MASFAVAEDDRRKVVSAITQVEAASPFSRLRRSGKITPADASIALGRLQVALERMVEQPVTPRVLELAKLFVDRHHLRGMDAIQLASAVVARDFLSAPDMRFISSDNELKQAALAEGFDVWDPTP